MQKTELQASAPTPAKTLKKKHFFYKQCLTFGYLVFFFLVEWYLFKDASLWVQNSLYFITFGIFCIRIKGIRHDQWKYLNPGHFEKVQSKTMQGTLQYLAMKEQQDKQKAEEEMRKAQTKKVAVEMPAEPELAEVNSAALLN